MDDNTDYDPSEKDLKYLKSQDWEYQLWTPSPALVDKNGFVSHQYVGQKYDPKYFTVADEGWIHDHCEICFKKFCEDEEECEKHGFVSKNQWLCNACYHAFIKQSLFQ